MPHSKREITAVAERRAKVAAMLLRGLRQVEIAEALGLGTGAAGQMVVSRDLKAVRAAWRASAVRDFDADKGRVLEELALVKREAWESWQLSKKDGGPGAARWLSILLDCWDREAQLLGTVAGPTVVIQEAPPVAMSADERRAAIMEVLKTVARGGPGAEEALDLLGCAGQVIDATPPAVDEPDAGAQCNGEHDAADALPYGLRELPRDDGPLTDDVSPLF